MADQEQTAGQPDAKKPEAKQPDAVQPAAPAAQPAANGTTEAAAAAPVQAAPIAPVAAPAEAKVGKTLETNDPVDLEDDSDVDGTTMTLSAVDTVAYAGTRKVNWANYADIRMMQKQRAAQEFKEKFHNDTTPIVMGRVAGRLGFIPLDHKTSGELARFQMEHFGSQYGDLTDAKRIEEKNKREAELKAQGKQMTAEELDRYATLSEKLVRGYRIDHSALGMTGAAYQIGEGGAAQYVYDRNGTVSARTNGAFNAKTALAMAMVYQGNRQIGEDGQKRTAMSVSINTRNDFKLFGEKISGEQKANLMVLSNLHLANRSGIAMNILVNGKSPDYAAMFDKDPAGMSKAVQELDMELRALNQPGIIARNEKGEPTQTPREAYEAILAKQHEIRHGHSLDSATLSDPDANGAAPAVAADAAPEAPAADAADKAEATTDDAGKAEATTDNENKPEIKQIEGPQALKALPAPESVAGDANTLPGAAAEDDAVSKALGGEEPKADAGEPPAPPANSGELGEIVKTESEAPAADKPAAETPATADSTGKAAGVTAKDAVGDNKTELGEGVPTGVADPQQAKAPEAPKQDVGNVLTAAANTSGVAQPDAKATGDAPKADKPETGVRSLPAPGKRGLG